MTLRDIWNDYGGHAADFITARNQTTGQVDKLPNAEILLDKRTLILDDYNDPKILENLAFDLDQTIEVDDEPSDIIRVQDVEGNPFQLKFYYSRPRIWKFLVDPASITH